MSESGSQNSIPTTDRTASNLELHIMVSSASQPIPKVEQKLSASAYKVVEVLVLVAIVLFLLAISMIPTVFFVIPPLEFKPVSL